MQDIRKDGRIERFIPTSKTVSVTMTMADYEAEKRRCKDDGYNVGLANGKRQIIFVLNAIQNREYGPDVIIQDKLSDQEFDLFLGLAKDLYGDAEA